MPAVGPSRQLRRMQWIAIILVTAAIAMNYMDRSTLAIGNLKIREEFGISATAIGALGSAWALTYGLAQLPSGYLLDRVGPKLLVGLSMIVWSLFQAAGGLAGSYFQLMLSRIGLGATEAPCFPSATRSVSDWFDVKHRGTPSGVYTSGAYIGPDARTANSDRPDASVQLAGDVHRHGTGWDRRCRDLVPDLP